MRKQFMVTVAGAIAVVLATIGTASASPAPRQEQPGQDQKWTRLADRTYDESVNAVRRADAAHQYVRAQFVAPLAWYAGQKFGWHDQRTQDWLNRLYGLRTPSRGYGLGQPYDAYGDGTTNPATTAYTITGAWHVGRTLLAGFDGGGVPAERVREVATWLAGIPLAAGGQCAAYSESGHDKGKPCVWNVSAAGAWFLWNAEKRGLVAAGDRDRVLAKVRSWRNEVRAHYRPALRGWTYQAGSAGLQDAWHNVATVAPMYDLDPSIGGTALAGQFAAFPGSAANADVLTLDCAKADGTFAAIERTATTPVTKPLDVLQSRAGFAPLLPRIAAACAAPAARLDSAPSGADRVAAIATAELTDAGHNHQVDGCNFYTGALGRTSAGCPEGWGRVAWCADFARWVWKRAGLKIDGLDAYAESFRKFGARHGTWHPVSSGYRPVPGDAIVYRDDNGNGLADHVGLVVANGADGLVTIEGNWGSRVAKRINPARAQGYTSPVTA
ncbi:CHAP domain-containing protein [Amycolatopsis samaneae]|uniref:CHAP domain-containing protein n=1 Tax=Amycolatopsis samaneae TaxID=664691 RepID=A0ABW5GD21_9PSEU